ncbi:MAG: M20 family metallopeptidase [Candidatus Limnocylindrales bacterium]
MSEFLKAAQAVMPQMVAIRRRLHRHPEQGLHLPQTQQTIIDELERLGLEPKRGTNLSSVTALIGADRPGRTVILRADMDALPLTESTGLEFASEIPEAMHACGHDTHVAQLLGAASLLVDAWNADPEALPGPVLLMFQPGEEGYFGARVMFEEGLLDGLDPVATRGFAIHTSAKYPTGEVDLRPGSLLASADNVSVTVRGSGGHASSPHLAHDPIVVAAEIVLALQTAVTRSVDVFDPAVLTIAHIEGGTTTNVIPETVRLSGTYRTVSDEGRAAMAPLVQRVVDGICAAHGVSAEVEFQPLYPVTVNDEGVFEQVRTIAAALVGDDGVVTMKAPIMGAEDWSYVLQQIPGVMAFVGARPPDRPLQGFPQNHSNQVVFDEGCMPVAAALYANVALDLV